ncbi:MAG: aminotransferase class I/II-fold pyridoxal phosphate-dependent enzyme [Deltaproteobacteria bacterium]|nr:aminotransferase class I/II-fold pyridoxal phosphate-dependent enzyme [Deltaproteobacteria bacterium]
MSAIAIVGMSCRFAGAEDLQAYWELQLAGKDAFREIPKDRWDNDTFYDENPRNADKSYVKRGAFLDDVRSFPALALKMPPRRVEVMDPQQRFSLEMALQAIEDSGRTSEQMPERTGVFMGVTALEYRSILGVRVVAQLMANGAFGQAPEDPAVLAAAVENVVPARPFTGSGGLSNMIASVVAQELNLHGPAWSVDAACTSSMIAITEAMRHLETHAVDAALAGGVYINLTPSHQVVFTRLGAMSADGTCRPFDHRASGFAQGEGAGMVMLKRLEDAERDGDRIYAVVRGYATNNDGKGTGPMAPVQDGQERVVREAWRLADARKAELGYLEAHGTGTGVGDVIELSGLRNTLGADVEQVVLGSSKANVGHTMSAAGVAGFIRTALAIHHGIIPPLAGFEAPKEELRIDETPFILSAEARRWKNEARVAGVSSFGFGGTNAHVILGRAGEAATPAPRPHLVLISAPDEARLRHLARRTADAVLGDPTITVAGVARAWAVRRVLPERLAIVADTREELALRLQAFAEGSPEAGTHFGAAGAPPKIAYLYPGQGSQRLGMIQGLLDRFPVVREALEGLEAELADTLPIPLTHLLFPERRAVKVSEEEALAQLTDTANTQPVLLAVAVALTRLLEAVGLEPQVLTGHSLGEFTAAAVGGVLSPAEAARFAARRGKLMADLEGDHGAMAALMCDRDTAADYLVDGAIIANMNHPRQVVVSGFTEAVEAVVRRASADGVRTQQLQVSHGFHSPALGALDSAPLLEGMDLSDPQRTVISAITTRAYADAADARHIFLRHAVSPVDFMNALLTCQEEGADLFLQVGAGGPLAAFARGTLARGHRGILTLASRDDADGGRSLLETLGRLWVLGAAVDVLPLTDPAPVASVPASILPREIYWAVKEKRAGRVSLTAAAHRVSAPAPTVAVAPAPTAPVAPAPAATAPAEDGVGARVIKIIAKVSAYPISSLRPSMSLIDDLGFDSLMVGDLTTYLAEAFPQMGGIPQELLINSPTVQDLVDYVERAHTGAGQEEVDDDAPLTGLAPAWIEAQLPLLPPRRVPEGAKVRVFGGEVPGLDAALASVGATLVTDGQADLLVFAALDEPVPVGQVIAGERSWPDLAGALAAALRPYAGGATDLIVLRRSDDPWAEALTGAAKALAREWSDATVKSVAVDAVTPALGGLLIGEWTSAETTVEVRYRGEVRLVPTLTQALPTDAPLALGPEDTVLLTGASGDIGVLLAEALIATGARLLLVSRSAPAGRLASLAERATHLAVDVTDREALLSAVAPHGPITALIHGAGLLLDGALDEVSPEDGHRVRSVKIDGWINGLAAGGATLKVAMGIGSWAGRFGNRHQLHYSAANALLSALAAALPVRAVVAEFGPWTHSAMTRTIPASVQATLRASGVDFVGDKAGVSALMAALTGGEGVQTLGRRLSPALRTLRYTERLSGATHPYLLDHAIEGTPVLPLAGAADLLVRVSDPSGPWVLEDLRLFQGVAVREPLDVTLSAEGPRLTLRQGEAHRLSYDAVIHPLEGEVEVPTPRSGGAAPTLPLAEFYRDITFHGPLLQGIVSIDAVGDDFVLGRVRTGTPSDWSAADPRARFHLDPLVLDSAMQLSAYVAWTRYGRAGTPVSMKRYTQLRPLPAGELLAEVRFEPGESDRFAGTVYLRDQAGTLLAVAEEVVAELRKVERSTAEDAPAAIAPQEEQLPVFKPEWVDFSKWKEVKDIHMRLKGTTLIGLRNPYFHVHDGTAKNTTVIEGREYVNFSSYNYLGLSGDERVLSAVRDAVDRYGTSVSASRVASGERPFHQDLEAGLAKAQGAEDALLFTAGHATNMNAIGHLFGPRDLILHDELIHDSILQGIKLAGSARRKYRHEDPADLEAQLKAVRGGFEKVLIVVEGVYSMDGDICDLPAFIALKKKYGCLLMVDEAHSFGIIGATGQGIREHHDIDGGEVDIWMGTLSKSLASCGGWIAGSKPMVTYLRYTAPGFVYSAGLTPANGMAALKALEYMLEEPWRVERLQRNAQVFHDALKERGVDTGPALGGSGVVPAVTGNSMHALFLAQRLGDVGINVQPIVYPAVADNAARLRFFLSSTHTEEQLVWTAEQVATVLEGVRAEFKL